MTIPRRDHTQILIQSWKSILIKNNPLQKVLSSFLLASQLLPQNCTPWLHHIPTAINKKAKQDNEIKRRTRWVKRRANHQRDAERCREMQKNGDYKIEILLQVTINGHWNSNTRTKRWLRSITAQAQARWPTPWPGRSIKQWWGLANRAWRGPPASA